MKLKAPDKSSLLSIFFAIMAILVFLFILVVMYLPNKPESVDYELKQNRLAQANTIRAEGIQKLNQLSLKDSSFAYVTIEKAIELILVEYRQK